MFEMLTSRFSRQENKRRIWNENTTPMAVFCSNYLPPVLTSRTGWLNLYFVKMPNVSGGEFSLTYAQHATGSNCDATHYKLFGAFEPDVDSDGNYRPNVDCRWTIISALAKGVKQLLLDDINIISDANCGQDYLQVSDDNGLIGTYCGSHPPKFVETTSRALYMTFHSDSTDESYPFVAFYAIIDDDRVCGGILNQPTGNIRSPDRDGNGSYDDGMFCIWLLYTPVNMAIELVFKIFAIEGNQNANQGAEKCPYDKLEVKVWGVETPYILCGNSLPSSIRAITDFVILTFYSDTSYNERGFLLEYTRVPIEQGLSSTVQATTSKELLYEISRTVALTNQMASTTPASATVPLTRNTDSSPAASNKVLFSNTTVSTIPLPNTRTQQQQKSTSRATESVSIATPNADVTPDYRSPASSITLLFTCLPLYIIAHYIMNTISVYVRS